MTEKEFRDFLMENKRKAEKAMENFEKSSRDFDRKISKILSGL